MNELSKNSKFTMLDAQRFREMYEEGFPASTIAELYDTTGSTVRRYIELAGGTIKQWKNHYDELSCTCEDLPDKIWY